LLAVAVEAIELEEELEQEDIEALTTVKVLAVAVLLKQH
jgi:hypothetical protein